MSESTEPAENSKENANKIDAGAEGNTMRYTKTVTAKKIEANRRNSKCSTGPRTQRGKLSARFNAVTLGLFAKHVVIAACDGYDGEKEFRTLLDALQQEFQPVGMFEEWLVVKMAECMWRLRRATRAENGSVRDSVVWTGHRNCDAIIEQMDCEISILTEAEGQLRDSGTLSQKAYEQVRPLVEREMIKNTQSENDAKRIETDIDCERFLTFIVDRKSSLESLCRGASYTEADRHEDHLAHKSLPPALDMERILLYEERMHRQLDWALQRLLQRQEMRMKTGNLPEPKRSQ